MTMAVSYIIDSGTRISLLSMKDCSFTNLLSIESTFPLKPFTDIIQPLLKGFVSKIKKPLKRFVRMSLAANPIVRPETLKRERRGFVSKPKVPSAERMKNAQVIQEAALAEIRKVSGSVTKILRTLLKKLSTNLTLRKKLFFGGLMVSLSGDVSELT